MVERKVAPVQAKLGLGKHSLELERRSHSPVDGVDPGRRRLVPEFHGNSKGAQPPAVLVFRGKAVPIFQENLKGNQPQSVSKAVPVFREKAVPVFRGKAVSAFREKAVPEFQGNLERNPPQSVSTLQGNSGQQN